MKDKAFELDQMMPQDDMRMTPEEAVDALKEIQTWASYESQHHAADAVLCALLRYYEQHEVVSAYNAFEKFYT